MDINKLKTVLIDQKEYLLQENPQTIPRLLEVGKSLKREEVTVISGIRRCGKSTVLKQIALEVRDAWNIHYLNFEDHRLRTFSFNDFHIAYDEFLEGSEANKKNLLLYDEIQNVENWEEWIASFSSNRNVKIFITGSNAKMLSTELSTLLTGRHEQKIITPFSFKEIVPQEIRGLNSDKGVSSKVAIQLRQFYKRFQDFGGFPRSYIPKDSELLKQYYDDIVLKDIAVRKKIRNISALNQLGIILASQNSRLLNKSKIAKEVGIKDNNTLSKFCSYFVETFLYSELRCFSNSRRKQLRSISKFYAADPIMAKEAGYHQGGTDYWILENLVLVELSRRYKDIWYWQSKDKLEVDFIVKTKDGDYHGYQVAQSIAGEVTKKREVSALLAAFSEIKISRAFIITEFEHEQIEVEKKKIEAIPFYLWGLDAAFNP